MTFKNNAFAISVSADTEDFTTEELRYGSSSMSNQQAWMNMAEKAGLLSNDGGLISVCSASKEDGPLVLLPLTDSASAILPHESAIPSGYPTSFSPAWEAAYQTLLDAKEPGCVYLVSCMTGLSSESSWFDAVSDAQANGIETIVLLVNPSEEKRTLLSSRRISFE